MYLHIYYKVIKMATFSQVLTVQGKSDYVVSIPSDLRKCFFIYAICVLSDDHILITDNNNKRVKQLNHQYKVVGHCDLTTYPTDMCCITPSEIAIIGNDYRTHDVQFVSVNGGRLVMGTKIQFQHICIGVAHDLQHLYLTSGTALYKYSMTGDLLNKLYEDTSGDYTVWKCAANPSGDKIFVTNWSHNKVLTLAIDGAVLHTFTDTDLVCPFGIHVTDQGQVLVCGQSSNTILQLDGEGKKKLATLLTERDGLNAPHSVCCNRSTASIIVGQYIGNQILVFKEK
ncbi:uncharacterized protein LOC127839440 isoform X1 [Dreissena polymorpha]|uniref:uncharacterized protein LOC127839440 isoform X1 n=1 Tax=Dreissena polymorpha TaxID=45954 RepID=UPI002264987B|nr:uncharacterized protein LOC127839440 isoform X1 [Dreissena polymorpha]